MKNLTNIMNDLSKQNVKWDQFLDQKLALKLRWMHFTTDF
jgi:hypothetical protein